MPKRIVILGAGFAGLQATIELEKLLGRDPDVEITLVNEHNYFLFTPLLPQIASSYINPRHIVQPVRDIRGARNFRFRRDTIRAINVYQHEVVLGSGILPFDLLLVALGSRSEYFNIPGAREHTLDFKSLEDAVSLRERVLDLCEHADHTEDATARGRMLTFVVVGGGYTGVELITDLRDLLLEYVAKNYRGIPRPDIQLILVEATDEILRGVHPSLAKHAAKRLRREGIKVRTGARVTRCFEGGVEINGEETIRAETIVWASGVRAHELVESLPGPHDKIGRCVVNEFLQMEKHPEVFILGDAAAAVTAPDAPRVAPVAIEHGKIAATNAAALLGVGTMRSYEYVSMGMLVTLGMNYAVVNVGGLKLRGYLAWLFWNAVHLYKLVGFKKQVQVALDWFLAEIFPRDAAIVRRQRNCPWCNPK
ncbi:MAG TPA: NAD(P)/FAD-dependent oxidoreductase [Candidatus Nitrosotenuis sp.]|nr:NAD(P)/FAD-dependent oxidoreductase [Candidatus Nitrosotenuis sp.]